MSATWTINPNDFIEPYAHKFDTPDLIQELGNHLADLLQKETTDLVEKGVMRAALNVVSAPVGSSAKWEIGVGDATVFGDEGDAAPEGTLRAFYDYYERVNGVSVPHTDWWGMSKDLKDKLREGRDAGMFGGIIGKAPYMWIQNYGNAKAKIRANNFLEKAMEAFENDAPDMVEVYLNK